MLEKKGEDSLAAPARKAIANNSPTLSKYSPTIAPQHPFSLHLTGLFPVLLSDFSDAERKNHSKLLRYRSNIQI
jgi:hypothetical protein